MDPISSDALSGLTTAMTELLSPAALAIAPVLEILPLHIAPTGLGGYVGPSHGPEGEVFGRRLEASARLHVRAATADALGDVVSAVTRALLAADRAALRGRGILRLDLDDLGPLSAPAAGAAAEREVRFKVLYEFLRIPTEGSAAIARIPLEIELGRGVAPRPVFAAELGPAVFSLFEPFDDQNAKIGGPSDWHADPEPRIEQVKAISSGSLAENTNKPGTYLVLGTAPDRPPVSDFVLRTTLRSGGTGGIGLVFRWQDLDNFYFFLMNSDADRNYRLLGRKVAGAFQDLETPALDKTQGFEAGRLYDVKLAAEGPAFAVDLDGDRILAGRDAALPGPGRVGLMSRNNRQAMFYGIDLVQL